MRNLRIGIDVGGTFTHAVAVELPGNQVIAHAVTPTTHTAESSVSEGIIKVFQEVIEKSDATPEEVCFVAHSTTQATNALLEGDVSKVGIVGMGKGLEAVKAKSDTQIKSLELSPGKFLQTSHIYLNSDPKVFTREQVETAVQKMKAEGCQVIVASEAFSVDNVENEQTVTAVAAENGLPATASHEISQLYGLKVRTRTAVVNASILPKMTATAELTDESIKKSGIKAPLMIMRSDGGVMDLVQMKQRPILTMLSGPAAGIAAALMFAKVSDGIFLEVGGTSTDISAIKNGKAMIKSANVGGHLTYLKTLDSRTVGIGGGSMVRMDGTKVIDVGPRSAHIAGLGYLAFSGEEEIADIRPELIQPMPMDPGDYLVAVNEKGKRFAVTLTDASIVAGMTKPGDYAYSHEEAVRKAFDQLAGQFQTSAEALARDILDKAMLKVRPVAEALLEEYELDRDLVSLVGGGGGSTAVVPWLSKKMEMKYLIARKAEVISAIGAALAMLRDSVERTVVEPTEQDILSIRKEAIGRLESMGADPATIEVQTEVEHSKNILRAIVTGAFQMDKDAADLKPASDEELLEKAAQAFKSPEGEIRAAQKTNGLTVFERCREKKKLFGLLSSKELDYRILDDYGVVKLQVNHGYVKQTCVKNAQAGIAEFIEDKATYNDVGMILPEVFLLYKSRIADYSSILDFDQLKGLIRIELQGLEEEEPVVCVVRTRK
ncbi:hydantoinase/oxoprolinase family protein [Diplocloster modestus]|uniref:Hydantoinase/oxoprolinase family protein n=1 Tax=Diplocloster modestus TaxID=2850322 RepID=A0ABS6KD35_9FIRM|nr:hydantoinase/oxoprolinase family protein [Diplocloster modestus]MBU9728434.1 hydantoinase/oxoprolinase family protein [Diplocloster modestus]